MYTEYLLSLTHKILKIGIWTEIGQNRMGGGGGGGGGVSLMDDP